MSDEKNRFSYSMVDEKSNFRHLRNTRFISHPYQSPQQSQQLPHHDSAMATDLNHLGNTSYLSSRLICDTNQPESPVSTETPNEEIKLTDTIKLPENLENLPKADEFPTRRSRWNTNEEILALLLNFSKHEDWQSKDVVIRPESGSMLMYSRKKVRYRCDGYCWKKRKDGKTTREDHMKLKVQGVECIYGCYVHSAVLPTFHRRCYWLLQNPDIVLVHYLNVPYPDDSKLAALIPNIAFWTEKKEWTREELLLQLKPMYENPGVEGGKEMETEEAKLNRMNVSSFIESMIAQLLEKQRYVRAALANSLECGCGNRKCLGASRCTRPIRRISSAKKQGKRSNMGVKLQEKRTTALEERNIIKTTAIRKMNSLNVENRMQINQTNTSSSYYNSQMPMNADTKPSAQLPGEEPQQLEQLIHPNPQQSNLRQQIPLTLELQPKVHQSLLQDTTNKDMMTNYSQPESYMPSVDYINAEGRHYQPNYVCPLNEQYVPNNEIEITNDEKQELSMTENVSSLVPYNHDENEFASEKYQSDTTDGSDCNSYSTIHHQASPNNSFTSVEDADTYANNELLDDLIMNVNSGGYNYDNGDYTNTTDRSLYELIIQLTQKEKKSTSSNAVVTTCEKLQQYEIQNEHHAESYSTMFENGMPQISDANGNFLSTCSRYSTITSDENVNHAEHVLSTDFTRIENNHVTNYSTEIDVNFMNVSNEFSSNERSVSSHSMQDPHQADTPCAIIELAPEWSYCEGGTKLLIIGPWYFPSEYAVLFDSYSVPATLVQTGVLKCYCPEHAVGLVSLQVVSGGSIISNSVIFEYKKRLNFDENQCHNFCNIKAEQYNQYMYENDTLLKFILIHRIEAIQDDAYTHGSSLVNKYEGIREKASM